MCSASRRSVPRRARGVAARAPEGAGRRDGARDSGEGLFCRECSGVFTQVRSESAAQSGAQLVAMGRAEKGESTS